MKVTVGQLRKIIKEETAKVLFESAVNVGDIVDYDWLGKPETGRVTKVDGNRLTVSHSNRYDVNLTLDKVTPSQMSPEEFDELVVSKMPSAADAAVAAHERDWEERRRFMGR